MRPFFQREKVFIHDFPKKIFKEISTNFLNGDLDQLVLGFHNNISLEKANKTYPKMSPPNALVGNDTWSIIGLFLTNVIVEAQYLDVCFLEFTNFRRANVNNFASASSEKIDLTHDRIH